VPDLNRDDACYNISKQFVPKNVTRQANLPPTDFTLVAIAPWISAECSLAYLSAAHLDPARGFIFFPPNNSKDIPADPRSEFWDLEDGDAWKTTYNFPVYAIPGYYGNVLMHQLAMYSGNMTSVPYGHKISELSGIDPRDYVRLYTELDVTSVSAIPSLWVLLLVVFGLLIFVLSVISALMHLIQRRRRKSLRRRVASGEVNLEALGIKQLTVPLPLIDRLPLFTYSAESEKSPLMSPEATIHKTFDITNNDRPIVSPLELITPVQPGSPSHIFIMDDTKSNHDSIIVHRFLPYSQPTCLICLEDFLSGETAIRELPCGHIFHPECIDTFLGNNSSLCPMCKKSCLPVGFCPAKITNAMVRRERNLRRIRSRIAIREGETEGDLETDGTRGRIRALKYNIKRSIMNTSPAQPNSVMPLQPQPVYMANAPPSLTAMDTRDGPEMSLEPSRDEIIAQRIQELAATQVPIRDPDILEDQQRPRCEY